MDRQSESLGMIGDADERVVIESGGANVVIRPSSNVDRAYTTSLVEVINAASATDVCVVIDPEPIRCDDDFAAETPPLADQGGAEHRNRRPAGAEVAMAGVVRLDAEGTVWLVDVNHGRFCRLEAPLDVRFLGDDAWEPVVALCVTPSRLIALNVDGNRTSANRAHASSAVSPS